MDNKNILVDTNILVYFVNESSDFFNISRNILENEEYKLFITTKNISELFNVLTIQKIEWDKILLFFHDLQQNFSILYPNYQSLNTFEMLCRKYKPHGNQVFDIEIVSIMVANELKTIATFNNKDFRNISEIEILNDCL